MDIHIGVQVGSLISILASFMYYGFRRSGERGFGRLATFWMGFPATLVIAMVVPAAQPLLRVADDEEALLREVRRDRAERLLAERASPEAPERGPDAPA